MLVRFTSSTSGDMIMFAEHAHWLFSIIGKECSARGVFTCEQLPQAIVALKAAIEEEKRQLHEAEQQAHEEDDEEEEVEDENDEDHKSGRVGIHLWQRATPLIHLMEWTIKEKGFILWETNCDF